jgi:DDE superfamily endonuclease
MILTVRTRDLQPLESILLVRALVRPLSLWGLWWDAILLLRPAFSRLRSFLWFATIVAGLTVRTELAGVTSIIRALNLQPRLYNKLRDHFHSSALKLDRLSVLWVQAVLRLFPGPLRVNGRLVLVGDGIKIGKRGKKMPAVKLLHQQSESNSKPEFIMGHSLQAVSLLVEAAKSVFAVPLAVRIHEGLVWSNRDRRTLLDKMLALLGILDIKDSFYFVADTYYAARKVANGLLKDGNHLITRVKSNAVAYAVPQPVKGRRKRGRPTLYGRKITLKTLLQDKKAMQKMASPVYGEHDVTLQYRVCDLLWRPAGQIVRFVVVIHPTRGSCILMGTDPSLRAIDMIRLYGLRFKIECSFKQAVHQIGTFAYHFWMKGMTPLRYRNGNQYLHRQSSDYRDKIKRKVHAYHVHIQAGVIAQGLLQYLSVAFPKLVWASFGSWLRTIRPGIPPSELVVANALRETLPEFLLSSFISTSLAKFIADRQDRQNMRIFRLAA